MSSYKVLQLSTVYGVTAVSMAVTDSDIDRGGATAGNPDVQIVAAAPNGEPGALLVFMALSTSPRALCDFIAPHIERLRGSMEVCGSEDNTPVNGVRQPGSTRLRLGVGGHTFTHFHVCKKSANFA